MCDWWRLERGNLVIDLRMLICLEAKNICLESGEDKNTCEKLYNDCLIDRSVYNSIVETLLLTDVGDGKEENNTH